MDDWQKLSLKWFKFITHDSSFSVLTVKQTSSVKTQEKLQTEFQSKKSWTVYTGIYDFLDCIEPGILATI